MGVWNFNLFCLLQEEASCPVAELRAGGTLFYLGLALGAFSTLVEEASGF